MTDNSRTRITGVHTVGVPVADQDRALEFYAGKLGFEKRLDVAYGAGQRWIEVAPPGATTTIALVSASAGVPAGVETGIRFVTGDAEADHADLLAAASTPTRCCAGRVCLRCSPSAILTATGSRSSSRADHPDNRGRALFSTNGWVMPRLLRRVDGPPGAQ